MNIDIKNSSLRDHVFFLDTVKYIIQFIMLYKFIMCTFQCIFMRIKV